MATSQSLPRSTARVVATVVVALTCSACVSGPPENAEPAGPERIGVFALASAKEIVLELPVGAANIRPSSVPSMTVDMEISCNPDNSGCQKLADNVSLTETRVDNRLIVGPTKRSRYSYRNSETTYQIAVPRDVPLTIRFGYGALTIKDLRNDLTITMSAGDVDIAVDESTVASVWLDANVGDASLIGGRAGLQGQRRWLVGAEVDWQDGPGKHSIRVDLGAGDITVRLQE